MSYEHYGEIDFEGWMLSLGYEYEYKIWKMISGNVGGQFFWNEVENMGWWFDKRNQETNNFNVITCEYGVRMPVGVNVEFLGTLRLTAEWFLRISQMENVDTLSERKWIDGTSWDGQGRGVVTLGIRI